MRLTRYPWLLLLSAAAALTNGCGDDGSAAGTGAGSADGGSAGQGGGSTGAGGLGGTAGSGGEGAGFGGIGSGGQSQVLEVTPVDPAVVTVTLGEPLPTLSYSASVNGSPVNAGWAVDQGNIGTITPGPTSTATFTPSGTTGGLATITTAFGGQTVLREVRVELVGTQNGPDEVVDAGQIASVVTELTEGGGIGGVGGEGLGGAVLDGATLDALAAPSSDGQAEGLSFLYPYDGTVWPRGLLAPNLMWDWSPGDADAIRIEITSTTGSFAWSGTFSRPEILAETGGNFVRHPIPQSIWKMATDTAGGADRLTVRLTVARDGVGYGPLEQIHTIAPARLSGVIHYNSYGTNLAQNYPGAVGGNGMFGGAVLSIGAGDAGPVLTAGDDGGVSQCRVCHSVSADGTSLVAPSGAGETFHYAIDDNGATPSVLATSAEFPALTPDGDRMLTSAGLLYDLPGASSVVPSTGLSDVSAELITPAFSPQGTAIAFGMRSSPSILDARQKLVVMTFDPITLAFSNPVEVANFVGQPVDVRPGWPAFFPDGQAVIFHQQSAAGVDGNENLDLRTRKGARARIAWTRTTDADAVTGLDRLNGLEGGVSYLPPLATPYQLSCFGDGVQVGGIDTRHENDVDLNFEPTVAPVASGGYAWVVFTSRRRYGSVAEIPPYCSDPRGVDLIENVTPKKLWVAAVDINGVVGTDPSHPAFYLPGQELLAGNSRGFWVLDPCKMDGLGCESGDECCNGFCQPDEEGNLVCQNNPPAACSGPQEVCVTAEDCCDPQNLCVNGFCSVTPPE